MFSVKTIPNMEHFLRVVERSKGDVLLHLPGGLTCNLKQDPIAMEILRSVPSANGFQISLSNRTDFPAFLQYLLEAGHRPAAGLS